MGGLHKKVVDSSFQTGINRHRDLQPSEIVPRILDGELVQQQLSVGAAGGAQAPARQKGVESCPSPLEIVWNASSIGDGVPPSRLPGVTPSAAGFKIEAVAPNGLSTGGAVRCDEYSGRVAQMDALPGGILVGKDFALLAAEAVRGGGTQKDAFPGPLLQQISAFRVGQGLLGQGGAQLHDLAGLPQAGDLGLDALLLLSEEGKHPLRCAAGGVAPDVLQPHLQQAEGADEVGGVELTARVIAVVVLTTLLRAEQADAVVEAQVVPADARQAGELQDGELLFLIHGGPPVLLIFS